MASASLKSSGNLTSFRKKGTDTLNIRGTRISVQNSQLLTSTGSSTLDFFIGGGLAVGTICLIEEDWYNSYSNLLLKIYLSEGVANNHSIFLSSAEKSPSHIIKELPAIRFSEVKRPNTHTDSSLAENLKIAWRYQNQSTTFSSDMKMDSYNHGYDLSKTLPEEVLQKCSVCLYDPSTGEEMGNDSYNNFLTYPYNSLLTKICSQITANNCQTSNKKCDNILRICLCSLGSPLWKTSGESDQQLLRFLYLLKCLLRSSFAVAVISLPSYLIKDGVLRNKIRQIGDTIIGLESFDGSDKKSNPLFKEFDGLLQIVKLPVLNTFAYPALTSDLAFKLKRKDFIIERLHLPPDFEDSQDEPGLLGCSGRPNKLDF